MRPCEVIGGVLKILEGESALLVLDIPDADSLIEAGGREGIVRSGVEPLEQQLLSVAIELSIADLHITGNTLLRDDPELDSAILRGSGEEVIVEGGEFEINNGAGVALDEGDIGLKLLVVVCLLNCDNTAALAVPGDLYKDEYHVEGTRIQSTMTRFSSVPICLPRRTFHWI